MHPITPGPTSVFGLARASPQVLLQLSGLAEAERARMRMSVEVPTDSPPVEEHQGLSWWPQGLYSLRFPPKGPVRSMPVFPPTA